MKKILPKVLFVAIAIVIYSCSGPMDTSFNELAINEDSRSFNSQSFSPAVQPGATIVSSTFSLSNGTYEVQINTMNPNPNAKVEVLNSSGSVVKRYYVTKNTYSYKHISFNSGYTGESCHHFRFKVATL